MAPRRIVQQAAGQTALPFAARAPRFDAKWLIIALCVALTLYPGVVPLGFLLWQSFFTPQSAAKAAEFTFGNYTEAYGSADTWILFGNSLKFATGAAALSFCIGTLLDESAIMRRANVLQVAARLTMPLALPAFFATLLILFVRAIESFEVPALLGLPVGLQVFTSAIYQAVHRYPSQIGLAAAYAVTLLAITSVGVYMQSRVSSSGSKYATMTGKGFRPRPIDLGRWRYLTTAIFLAYFLFIVVLPFAVLLWSSLQRFYAVPSMEALSRLTLDPYPTIISYPNIARSVWNSLLLAVASATIIMLVTSVICWIVVKTKLPGRWLLDNFASLPMVFPGIVLGLAIMILYLTLPVGIYGTIWIMLIAYITRFMPYGLRYNTTSMLQIHKELEESAAMSGASWTTTFRRIILPLLKPGLVAGWIYIVIVSIRELSSSILLYSPGTEVLSIVIWELWENGQYVELSALGVLFILGLFVLVLVAQWVGRRFGIKEA